MDQYLQQTISNEGEGLGYSLSEQNSSDHVAAKKKRVITERRRAQGRAAQKAYREKQKARKAAAALPDERQTSNLACRSKAATLSSVSVDAAHDMTVAPGSLNFTDVLSLNLDDQVLAWSDVDTSSGTPTSLDVTDAHMFDNDHALDFTTLLDANQVADALASNFAAPNIPMDSYIRVPRYSFHAASIQNSFILGITWDRIKAHTCGHDELSSPWVSEKSHDIANIEAVAEDLRPGENQRRYKHELYIDTLPFRDFREKVLALRGVEPKVFDEDDFIRDLDFRDAMQCWGPTPWENKSWEVQRWFLRKWWMITGGDKGEMAATSRWWRMLRGEQS